MFFKNNQKSQFWLGIGAKNIEFFTSIAFLAILLFLFWPNSLLNCAILATNSIT
jgi:hypothetical protein